MSVRVTIEAASKAEAELIAQELPRPVDVRFWRGLGVIRVGAATPGEANTLMEAVSRSFHKHRLVWARVRYGDEERVFRANGRRPG